MLMRNSILAALLGLAFAHQAAACTLAMTMTNDAGTPVTSTAATVAGDTDCSTTQTAWRAAHGLSAPGQPAATTPDAPTVNAMAKEAWSNLMSEVQRIQAAQIQPMAVAPAQ